MTRHSKNSTAGAFFTSAERERLSQYGTQRQRVSRDSFRRPDACCVCLQPAVAPVCCTDGHLFCRECILQAILAQKQATEAQQKAYDLQERRGRAEAAEQKDLALKRQIREFEERPGNKRAKGDEPKRPQLNAFWMPSKTPTASTTVSAPRRETICPAAEHPITTKRLTPVRWTMDEDAKRVICKLCVKDLALVNGTTLYPSCGHVICRKCHGQIGESKCAICSVESPRTIRLAFDGTGFAGAGGNVEVKRHEPALI